MKDGRESFSAPDLLIFDCDGVLVDSEPIANRVLAERLTAIGYPIAPAECEARFTGLRFRTVFATVEAELGRKLPPGFGEEVRESTLAAFTESLQPIRGVAEAVQALDLPRCVASSSAPDWIRHALAVTGLIGLFDPNLFSAVMVPHGKPHPDLFLLAAERMGARPEHCLVIEDSVPGVTAAKAAGMRVLGFVGGGHARSPTWRQALREAGAALLFDDMRRLPGLVDPDAAAGIFPADEERRRG